jgi:hypothetical protein
MSTENDTAFEDAFKQLSAADATENKVPTGPAAGDAPPALQTAPTGPTGTAAPTEGPTGTVAVETLTPTELAAKAATDEAATDEAAAKVKETETAQAAIVAQAEEDLLKRLGGVLKKAAPEPVAVPQMQRVEPDQPQSPFTQEQAAFLAAYEKEFPDIAAAERLQRRADLVATTGYIFGEITRSLQPIIEQVQVLAQRTHLGDLHTAVPDYDATRDQVIAWVDKQPAYLKAAYQAVVAQGTAAEVADLIKRYHADTGTPVAATADPAAAAAAAAAAAKTAKAEADRKAAAAALAPVGSKRSVAVASEPTDFDGAFAAAAALKDL